MEEPQFVKEPKLLKKLVRFGIINLTLLILALNGQEEATLPVSINLSGSSRSEYWFWTKKDTALRLSDHFETKFSILLNYENFFGRATAFLYEPSRPKKPLRLFNFSLEYRSQNIEALLGNFYQVFGRGLVLRSFSNEDFRYDKILYGGRFVGHFLSSDITLFAGRVRSLTFEENRYKIENDTTDQLRGIEFLSYLFPFLEFGARYVRLNKERDVKAQAFTEIFGPNLSLTHKFFETYYEYCEKWSTREIVGGRKKGFGHYWASSIFFPGFGLSFSVLKYDSIDLGGEGYRYNDPPVPLRQEISINRGKDERGYGINLAITPLDYINLEGNYGLLQTADKNRFAKELGTKAQLKIKEDYELAFGFENLKGKGIEIKVSERDVKKLYKELRLSFLSHTFELIPEIRFVCDDRLEYQERGLGISYGYHPYFVLTFFYLKATKKVAQYDYEDSWVLVEIVTDITNNISFNTRIGNERGGLVCSGGVCRYEMPFAGIKSLLTIRF